ncbi:MAG TPA: HIT domain-containing protein [Pyrinomonadaceae bacterium]|nr:HIT domain-containing protein [Pyrinomonadaceae bacterium]
MTRAKVVLLMIATLLAGIAIGGYLFKGTRPRSFLAIRKCQTKCLQTNELLGLVASVGVQHFSGLVPSVVKETDKTLVIDQSTKAGMHYVIIPKKDMKNIGDASEEDTEYLADALKVAGEIVREKNLTNYVLTTNGPAYQTVTYLHFHLTAYQ